MNMNRQIRWHGANEAANRELIFEPSVQSEAPRETWPGSTGADHARLAKKVRDSRDFWRAGDTWFALNDWAQTNPSRKNPGSATEPTPPPPGSDYDEYIAYASQLAPIVNQMLFGREPEEKAAILRSKIKTYESLLAQADSTMVRALLQSQIDKLVAQLAEVDKIAGAAAATREANLALRYLGLGAAGLGMLILLQTSFYLRKKTAKL
jgi:hypothetical protein